MDNQKIIRLLLATKNRFDILEYSLEVAEIKIKTLEKLLLKDEQKSQYVSEVRTHLKNNLANHRNPELQKLLDDLDAHDDF